MRAEIENNGASQHVHTNGAEIITSPRVVQILMQPNFARLSISRFRVNFQPHATVCLSRP